MGKGTQNAQMHGPRTVTPELASQEFPHITLAEGVGAHFDGLTHV